MPLWITDERSGSMSPSRICRSKAAALTTDVQLGIAFVARCVPSRTDPPSLML